MLEVCSTSREVVWWADWYACRGNGGREDPSPREELGEQVISRVLQASFFFLDDRLKRRLWEGLVYRVQQRGDGDVEP